MNGGDQAASIEVEDRLRQAARDDCPRILSILASRYGDLDVADEAVQDALVDASRSWPTAGVPNNPGGWLMTTARRRAVDQVRSARRQAANLQGAARELHERLEPADPNVTRMIGNSRERVGNDERLRLMLLCCHPALGRDAQVALTLRLVAGLTTPEISRAFLVPDATLAQRIVRAKAKIRDANIPLSLPARLDERLDVVLAVLYLVFNEGYLASSGHSEPVRVDLMDESIRLVRLLTTLVPNSAEVAGLLALQLFHAARSESRFDETGELVLLDDQDRTQWDRTRIDEANQILSLALQKTDPGAYQMQALIAAQHANAATSDQTDWASIVAMYDQLKVMTPSPVVSLNRAVAVAMADGPLVGLRVVDGLVGLDSYHLYWATKGELHHRAGDNVLATIALRRALELVPSETERRHLSRRLAEVSLG